MGGVPGSLGCMGDPTQNLSANDSIQERGHLMLHYAVVFFVIALIAALLGFSGIAGTAVGIAKLLFLVFLVLAVLSLIFGRRVKP
jgi:uncharacterized membrane protein YtjA (UPF0391 family)